jgi:hypothetical protein
MREDWIKDLKVGDKVVVESNNYGKAITSVEKITPKGFIKTKNGHQFNPDGSQRGGSSWTYSFLSQLTDEVLLKFKKKLVNQCKEIDFSKLNIDDFEQILNISEK